jgi:hypothetical protein
MNDPVLARSPRRLRPWVEAFVPAAAALSEAKLVDLLERADTTLANRPAALRRKILLAAWGLGVLAVIRFVRPVAGVPVDRLRGFLQSLQDGPILPLRLAVWGLRTLIFAGYYGQTERQQQLGYRPRLDGWASFEKVDGHEQD